MNNTSIDWELCKEYRQRMEAKAAKWRLIQTLNPEATTSRNQYHWLRQFREAFVDDEPEKRYVALHRLHQH